MIRSLASRSRHLPTSPWTAARTRTVQVHALHSSSCRGIRIARPEEEDLRHYCSAPIPNAASLLFLEKASPFEPFTIKPSGLWLSERDEWRRWAHGFRAEKTAGYHPMLLKPDARLICCTTAEDLAAVEQHFLVGQPPGLQTIESLFSGNQAFSYIRWSAMRRLAPGMYLSHEMAIEHHLLTSSRFAHMVNAWDVGSVVLWDPRAAIESVGDWVESPPPDSDD